MSTLLIRLTAYSRVSINKKIEVFFDRSDAPVGREKLKCVAAQVLFFDITFIEDYFRGFSSRLGVTKLHKLIALSDDTISEAVYNYARAGRHLSITLLLVQLIFLLVV